MKLKITLSSLAVAVTAQAATNVPLTNFRGGADAVAIPIVDNAGNLVIEANSTWDIGTFTPAFAATLGALDIETADAEVIAAFTSASDASGEFRADGLFGATLATDTGNPNQGADIYALITYTPTGGAAEALVLNLGAAFPEQDGAGNAAVPSQLIIDATLVAFGNKDLVPVNNPEELPNAGLQAAGTSGLTFNAIPEPSTSLLALVALGFIARRRR